MSSNNSQTLIPVSYAVQIYTEDGNFLFQSDVFNTKNGARSLIDYMTTDGTRLIYVAYKHKPQASTVTNFVVGSTDCSDEEFYENSDEPLSGMIIEKHGRGYILIPSPDDPRCGEKYFYDGWWKPQLNAWFYKAEFLSNLYELGAEPQFEYSAGAEVTYSDQEDDHDDQDQEGDHDQYDLTGMTMRKHGKGFLLIPNDDYELFGTLYFMDGLWIPKHNAWFFKAEFYDNLLNLGAVEETTHKTSRRQKTKASASHFDLSKMALVTYGKGFLLITHESDPEYGMYYFTDTHGFSDSQPKSGTYKWSGFWNSKGNGWFFKKDALTYLTNEGVTVVKNEPTDSASASASDSFIMSDDLSTMKLSHYGKGYILTPRKNDSQFGEKYFNLPDGGQGWWRQDLSGWFFKSQYFEELVDMGAKFSEKSSKTTRSRTRSSRS